LSVFAYLTDIVDLLTFPVALTGKETGLKRYYNGPFLKIALIYISLTVL